MRDEGREWRRGLSWIVPVPDGNRAAVSATAGKSGEVGRTKEILGGHLDVSHF